VYVLSSIYEGLSNSLLEALACDIPIVTTDNPDNIIRDGINGFEVELSPKSIANGITRLLENDPLRKSIIKNNSEYKNQFGIDIMISKYEELFNEMLV
jgi:glycosyltransferase involved in cell wall biosynthesis